MILTEIGKKRLTSKENINGAWAKIPITIAGKKIKIICDGMPCLNRIAPKANRITLPHKYVGKKIKIICMEGIK